MLQCEPRQANALPFHLSFVCKCRQTFLHSSLSHTLCSLSNASVCVYVCVCVEWVSGYALLHSMFETNNCTGFQFNCDWVYYATTRTTLFRSRGVVPRNDWFVTRTHVRQFWTAAKRDRRRNERTTSRMHSHGHSALRRRQGDVFMLYTLSKCRRGNYVMNELCEGDSEFVWSGKSAVYGEHGGIYDDAVHFKLKSILNRNGFGVLWFAIRSLSWSKIDYIETKLESDCNEFGEYKLV